MIRIQWRVRTILLLVALVGVTLVSLPQSEVGAATGCVATPLNGTVVLSWDDDGSRYNVRRDGKWIATPGSGVSSYTDTSPTASPSYELIVRKGDAVNFVTCVLGQRVTGCSLTVRAGSVLLEWKDNGGKHIVRRNGDWLATPGEGSFRYVDQTPVAGASYVVRTIDGATPSDRECVPGGNPPPPDVGDRRFVVHVSIDGLRADAVTFANMPTLNRLGNQGAETMNARTDPALTKTLPNHTSQFTGRFVWGLTSHRVTFNDDNASTIHATTGSYVPSVFDVVHDNGGRTVLYTGKTKFNFFDRSYDGVNGAPDTTGVDNGRDKIDVFVKENPVVAPPMFVDDLVAGSGDTFGFFHIRTPDERGHADGWNSAGYREGLRDADAVLAELIERLDDAGALDNTTIIVTADHGGPAGGNDHSASGNWQNYTVPFIVWGADVASGADLYALNPQLADPGSARPGRNGAQPVRGHAAANLALDLLGLPALPGATVNADQSFAVE